MADDPFLYPDSKVLRNRKGFRDAADLERFEAQVAAVRMDQLEGSPINGAFDLKHLQAVHRHIFQDVYPWAGQLRDGTGMMSKTRLGATVVYGNSAHVSGEAGRVLSKLAGEKNLRGLDAAEFVQRLAFYYSELDAIHPFREGNSRTLRSFTYQLAKDAGQTLDWRLVSQTQDARDSLYRARDVAVMTGEIGPLSGLISQAIAPSLAHLPPKPKRSAVGGILDALRPPRTNDASSVGTASRADG